MPHSVRVEHGVAVRWASLRRVQSVRGPSFLRESRSRRVEGAALPAGQRMTARRLSGPALEARPGSGSGRHRLLGRDELEHRQKGDPGAAEEDERDQVAGRMEAVGPARDGSDLPVHPLGAPIVEAKRDVREDAFEVILDRASELLEGLDARSVGPADPLAKLDARDVDIQTIERSEE